MKFFSYTLPFFVLAISLLSEPGFSRATDAEARDRILILEEKVRSVESLLKKNKAILSNLTHIRAISGRRLKQAKFEVQLAEHQLEEAKEELATSSKTNWEDFTSLFKLMKKTAQLRVEYEEEKVSTLQKLVPIGAISQNELIEAQFQLEEAQNALRLATRRLENAELKR